MRSKMSKSVLEYFDTVAQEMREGRPFPRKFQLYLERLIKEDLEDTADANVGDYLSQIPGLRGRRGA